MNAIEAAVISKLDAFEPIEEYLEACDSDGRLRSFPLPIVKFKSQEICVTQEEFQYLSDHIHDPIAIPDGVLVINSMTIAEQWRRPRFKVTFNFYPKIEIP